MQNYLQIINNITSNLNNTHYEILEKIKSNITKFPSLTDPTYNLELKKLQDGINKLDSKNTIERNDYAAESAQIKNVTKFVADNRGKISPTKLLGAMNGIRRAVKKYENPNLFIFTKDEDDERDQLINRYVALFKQIEADVDAEKKQNNQTGPVTTFKSEVSKFEQKYANIRTDDEYADFLSDFVQNLNNFIDMADNEHLSKSDIQLTLQNILDLRADILEKFRKKLRQSSTKWILLLTKILLIMPEGKYSIIYMCHLIGSQNLKTAPMSSKKLTIY